MRAALNICSKLRVEFLKKNYPCFSLVLFSSSVELLVKKAKRDWHTEEGPIAHSGFLFLDFM